ncbi:hypothetical protein BJ875DRAFT_442700 [Amylocarpus encephaloides]|uniref:Uncharacterized protein n=1 Tax=Amylocarpus encephaloides TaxID=45428 RepID=A0A9P7YFH6_9HELO|nr:hypothetical protein BJ875DRAFT_442700 [Amylocarpus encephaloides]
MAKYNINHTAFTLRMKHGRHTILLFADPLATFSKIKVELLEILRERYPNGLPQTDSPDTIPIPESINDVVLGVPNDIYDHTRGWTELDIGISDEKDCPKSMELKDGSMVAFTFSSGNDDGKLEFNVEFSNVEELYPEDE